MRRHWSSLTKFSRAATGMTCPACQRPNGNCSMADIPPVPLTVEGQFALHQMFRFRRPAWRNLSSADQDRVLAEAIPLLACFETGSQEGHPNQSALYSQIGHKGDLMLLHFRDSLEDLHRAELRLAQLELADYLESVHSYISVVEL